MSQQIIILMTGIIPVMLILFVFLFFLRKMIRRHSNYRSFDELKREGAESFKCPRCGNQMDYGFRMANQGIIWRLEQEKMQMVAPQRMLENTMNFTMKNKENPAWHCKGCKLIIIDHNYLVGK